jgi:hypothetical protein
MSMEELRECPPSRHKGRRAILWSVSAICAATCVLATHAGAVAQSESFAQRVAMRCKGELPAALSDCACTVHTRLALGWSEEHVLDAYYAQDRVTTETEVAVVRVVLDHGCPLPLYFMYSRQDAIRIGVDDIAPLKIVKWGVLEAWFYEFDYPERRQQ